MALGSLLGGLALSNTRTTICHSVSYPMTIHWGIPHGQATSITLPLFIEYTFPVLPKAKLLKILKAMNVSSIESASKRVKKLMINIGLKTRLSELGITEGDLDLIVREGFDPARAKNAPKIPSPRELENMLHSIL
jgi:alcohol dehydrogenase class IV